MAGMKGRSGGHNRKSLLELQRAGTFRLARHGHLAKTTAAPAVDVLKPARLSTGAAVVWDELAPIAIGMGTLTPADAWAFSTLCELQASFTAAVRLKDTDPEKFSWKLERDTAAALRPYLGLFGFDPVSRSRLHVTPAAADDNPLDKFINRKSKWAGIL